MTTPSDLLAKLRRLGRGIAPDELARMAHRIAQEVEPPAPMPVPAALATALSAAATVPQDDARLPRRPATLLRKR